MGKVFWNSKAGSHCPDGKTVSIMAKLGIISDTHGLLRVSVAEELRGCEAVLHAGDIDRPEILNSLRELMREGASPSAAGGQCRRFCGKIQECGSF